MSLARRMWPGQRPDPGEDAMPPQIAAIVRLQVRGPAYMRSLSRALSPARSRPSSVVLSRALALSLARCVRACVRVCVRARALVLERVRARGSVPAADGAARTASATSADGGSTPED